MSKLIYVDRLKKDILDLPNCYNGFSDTYDKACIIGVIDEQPTIEERKWIPCSERLPDQYGNYLISIDREEPDIGTINPNDPRGWSLCDANGFYWASDKALNITAWMPLPEPYTERREE